MTTGPGRPLSRQEIETLLAGGLRRHPLSTLVAAAAAPARPDELVGEVAATAHFRTHRVARTLTPGRGSMPASWFVRIAAAKVLAGAAATTVVCGVALAATTGVLPGPLGVQRPVSAAEPSAPATPWPWSTPARSAGHTDAGRLHPSPDDPLRRTRSGRPLPAVAVKLACRVWLITADAQHARTVAVRPFEDLVRAAGGAAKVHAYCIAQVGPPPAPPKPGTCPRLPHRPEPTGVMTPDLRGGPTRVAGATPSSIRATPLPSGWPMIVWVPCPITTLPPVGDPYHPVGPSQGPVPVRSAAPGGRLGGPPHD